MKRSVFSCLQVPASLAIAVLGLVAAPGLLSAAQGPPVITGTATVTINENATATLSLTISDPAPDSNPGIVTLLVDSSTVPGVVPVSGINFTTLSATTRTLSILPATNQFGTSTVKIVATNSVTQMSSTNAFTVNVNYANQPPFFIPGGDVTVSQNSAAYSATWATGIAACAGPLNATESAQVSTFHILSVNPTTLFGNGSSQPAISRAGVLTFQPALNASGSATIKVYLVDNGAGSGVSTNTSVFTNTFLINVNPVGVPPTVSTPAAQVSYEDAVCAPIAVTITDVNNSPNNVVLLGTSDTLSLINPTNFIFGGTGSNRTVSVLPVTNQFGTANVLITASNTVTHLTGTCSFPLSINFRNQAPVFTPGTDVTVFQNSGAYTHAWASNLAPSSAPVNSIEAAQALGFTVVNNNNALFITQPAISPTGVLTFQPAPNSQGSATVTAQLRDNGTSAGNGDTNGSVITNFFIIVAAQNPPTISSIATQTVAENTALGPISVTLVDLTDSVNDLVLSGTSSTTTLINPASFSFGGSGANRTISILPLTNQFGSTTVTVGVSNVVTTLTNSMSFPLQVLLVNQAPTFSSGANVTVGSKSGAYSAPWASNLSPGPASESGQALNFIVTNNSNALFAVQPAISSTGVLTFTPSTTASGSANVTVQLHDNGGTANGGNDTSAARTFAISVIFATNHPPVGTSTPILVYPTLNHAFALAEFGFSDPGDNPADNFLAIKVTTLAGLGTLTDNGVAVTVGQSVPVTDIAAGKLVYTPGVTPSGNNYDNFSFQVQDDGGTANGGSDTDPNPKTITLNYPVPPWITSQPASQTIFVGGTATFSIATGGFGPFTYQWQLNGTNIVGANVISLVLANLQVTNAGAYTVVASSPYGSATSAPAQLTVASVNQPPSFALISTNTTYTVSTFAGAPLIPGNVAGVGAAARLNGPTGLAADSAGNVYVTEANSGAGALAHISPDGTLGIIPLTRFGFQATNGIAIDVSGNLYLSDAYLGIVAILPPGGTLSLVESTVESEFYNYPGALAVDQNGVLWISDTPTSIIFRRYANGLLIDFANSHTAPIKGPLGLATDLAGNLYMADSGDFTVRRIDLLGNQSVPIGLSGTSGSADGTGSAARFGTLFGIAVDGAGIIYVADNSNSTIRRISPLGMVTTIAGVAGVTGTNDGPGTLAHFNAPCGIAVDSSENIYVADFNNSTIRKLTPQSAPIIVLENAGNQAFTNFAVSMASGPAWEAGQLLNFIVNNDNHALFSVQPAINDLGTLTFTLAQNVHGSANVTVKLHDNGGTANGGVDTSAAQTFVLSVLPVDQPPVGTSNSVTTLEGAPYVFGINDFGFSDPNDGPPNNFLAVKTSTLPLVGTLADNGIPVTSGQFVQVTDIIGGKLSFTPATNANGNNYASFTFQVQDDGGTANGGVDTDPTPRTMTVKVTPVNNAPAGTSTTVTTLEDTGFIFVAGNFGFTDPNDSPANNLLAVKISTLPQSGSLADNGAAVTSGQLIPVADITGGKLRFSPVANANGANYANFTFRVQDDGGTANGGVDTDPSPKTMTIAVTPVNDAPTGTSTTVITPEDTAYTFTAANFGFADPNDNPANNLLAVKISSLPLAGGLADNGTAVASGQFVSVADLTGGKLKFTPTSNGKGNNYASFTFQVQDNGGTANGGVDTDPIPRTMTINVTSVNDAPLGVSTSVAVSPNTTYTFTTASFGFTDPNDQPANNFLAVKISALPLVGTLADNGTSVTAGQYVSVTDITAGKLVYTPGANASGNNYASFTFQVQDDGGTANGGVDTDPSPKTMTVNMNSGGFISAPNRVDMVHDSTRNILYISSGGSVLRYDMAGLQFLTPFTLSGALSGMDISPDGNTLAVADASQSGTNVWIWLVNLNNGSSQKILFSQALLEGGTFTVAYGFDGAILISSTFQGSGTVPLRRYDPATSTTTVINNLILQSSMLCASGDRKTIGVAESNSSGGPVDKYDVASRSIVTSTGTGVFNYEIGVSRNGSQVSVPTYTGSFVFDSFFNYVITLGVYAGPHPIGSVYHPTLDVAYYPWSGTSEVRAYDTHTFQQIGSFHTSSTFSDPGNLAFVQGRIKLSQSGDRIFVSTSGGIDWFVNTAISVTFVNHAPAGASGAATAVAGTPHPFKLADFGFTDLNDTPPNDIFAVKTATLPATGTLNDNGTPVNAGQFVSALDIVRGLFTYTPPANASGANYASFTFQVQDDGGTANGGVDTDPTPKTMTLNATPINDAPLGVSTSVTVPSNTAYTFATASFGFTDPSDHPANNFRAVKISALPLAGTLADNGTAVTAGQFVSVADLVAGKLTFTPVANATGNPYASFSFQVQDDGGTANGGVDTDPSPKTMTINVNIPTCDPPPSGLVGWWRGEGNPVDSISGNNGTNHGGLTYGAGEVGQAFITDGTGGGIVLSNVASLQMQNFTIETWIQRGSTTKASLNTGGSVIFGYGHAGYAIGMTDAGQVYLTSVDLTGSTASGISITDTNWHHFVATKTNTTVVIYVDGTAYATPAMPSTFTFTTSPAIGTRSDDFQNGFLGRIDEVSIYNRVLSGSEVSALYNSGSAGKCFTPVLPTIANQPAGQSIPLGLSASFSVVANGTGPLTYQWQLNGTNLVGATNSILVISAAQTTNAGSYTVAVASPYGSANSTVAQLIVTVPTCDPPPAGLVSWWKGDGTTGDFNGGNSGSLTGNAGYGTGMVSQAFVLDGTGDGIVVGNPANLQLQDFSIEAWILRGSATQASPTSGGGTLFGYGSGGYAFGIADDGRLYLSTVDGNGIYANTVRITDTNWHHVAAAKSGTNVVFYADGIAYTAPPFTYGPFLFTKNLAIGIRPDTLVNGFIGSIDELAIYNRQLTGAEMTAIYSASVAGKCFTPVSPTIATQPASQSIPIGLPVSFAVVATGSGPLTYQWQLNGTNLTGATGPTLVIASVQATNAGNYDVVVSSPYGSMTSSSASLTINPVTCDPPPSGLVGWWQGEDSTLDLISGASGTVNGNLRYAPALVGHGFVSDGTNAGVLLNNTAALQLQNFTIETWIQRRSVTMVSQNSQGAEIFGYGDAGYGLGLKDDGRVFLTQLDLVPGFANGLTITDTNWHHVVVTKTNSTVVFYLDGVAYSAPAMTAVFSFNTSPSIGFRSDTQLQGFLGSIDEVSVYNRALSAAEIMTLYGAASAGKCYTPVPPSIVSQPAGQSLTFGLTANFAVVANGSGPVAYQWRLNGTNLTGATGPTLVITSVQSTNAGNYDVAISSPFGSVVSSPALLSLSAPSCNPPPSGMVSWWKADGTAGDALGGNNGALVGNAGYQSGFDSQAFVLDGTGDGVMLGNPSNLQLQDFSIEAWIQRSSASQASPTAGGGTLFGYGSGGYVFGIADDGRLFTSVVDANGIYANTVRISDTNWHHVAVTKSGTNVVFYGDGIAYTAPPFTYGPFQFTKNAAIGIRADTLVNGFKGLIDELSVYNRQLSGAEIAAIYNSSTSGKCFTPILPVFSAQPAGETVAIGTTANLSAVATGSGPLTYQWQLNGTNLAGATSLALTIPNAQFTNGGSYTIVVTSPFGSATSLPAQLIVTTPQCTSPPAGLVGWWKGESSSLDLVSGTSGTANGNLTYGGGEVGQAFVTDGTSSGVKLNNSTSLQLQNFTIETWIKRGSTNVASLNTGGSDIFGYGHAGYALGMTDAGQLYLSTVDLTGGAAGGIAITDTNWHHLAATKNNSTVIIYVDGIAYSFPNITATFTFATSPGIGIRTDSLRNGFLGSIDEVSVYNRPLSGTEVAAVFQAGSAGKCFTPAAPVIAVQPANQTVTTGFAANFGVVATGYGPLTYQWQLNGTNLASATTSTLVIPNIQTTNAGSYTVTVSNPYGSTPSSSAQLTVFVPPPNSPPIGTPGTVTALEDTAYAFLISDFGFTDPNDSPPNNFLAVKIPTLPSAGTLSDGGAVVTPGQFIPVTDIAAGKLKFIAATNANGSGYTSVAFQVQDDGGTANAGIDTDTTPRSLTINVTPVNDAPSFSLSSSSSSYTVTTFAGLAGSPGSANGTGSSVRFNGPNGLALDTGGFIYVTDVNNNSVRRLSSSATVAVLLGVNGVFFPTNGIAVDSATNLFVSDVFGRAIRKCTPPGVLTTFATGFNIPIGVATDRNGNVYVADSGNSFIYKVSPAGVVSGLAGPSAISSPQALAVDGAGNVYVANAGDHTIRKVTAAGVATILAGQAGVSGSVDGLGSAALFGTPMGIAVDSTGTVYVSDANNTIRKVTAAGLVTTIAGATTAGSLDGPGNLARFNSPRGIAVDAAGNVFVADYLNCTIRKLTPTSVPLTISEDAGPQTVSGFASNISSGPSDESGQTVNFIVSNDNTALFSVQPAISSSGILTYTTAPNASGSANVAVVLHDNGGTANGGSDTSTVRAFVISVAPLNDAPSGLSNIVSTPENIAYTFATLDFGFSDPNDAPPNNFKAVMISTLPANGTLLDNGIGVTAAQFVSVADITAGQFKFMPGTNATGAPYTSFTFQVQDDGGISGGGIDTDPSPKTMTINVTPVNHPPIGTSKTIVIPPSAPYAIAVADFGFTDPNDNPPNHLLSVFLNGLPQVGILADNGTPVIGGQFVSASDIAAGNLTYTPPAGGSATNTVSFSFQLRDDGGTANGGSDIGLSIGTLTIHIAPDRAPLGTATTVTTLEGTPFIFLPFSFGFSDPNDNPPDIFLAVKISTVPSVGTLSDNGVTVTAGQTIPVAEFETGKVQYLPATGNGSNYASFTFQVQDDGGTVYGSADTDPSPKSVTINVSSLNHPPVGTSAAVADPENTPYTFAVGDFGFSDPQDNPANHLLAVKIAALPLAGVLTDNGTVVTSGQSVPVGDITGGKLQFTPGANAVGNNYASFTFQVQDDGGTGNGSWATTGPLNAGRFAHTATLLPSGKVLIAGGASNNAYNELTSEELFDPGLGKMSVTGSLVQRRSYSAATLLPNGKVFFAGAILGAGVIKQEVYDPSTGTNSAAGQGIIGRNSPMVTLLPNGKVLIAGGYGVNGPAATAELYDTATGTNTATGSLSVGRAYATAVLLTNGKVLISGGYTGSSPNFVNTPSQELYDPATGTFTPTGNLSTGRYSQTATLLPNGQVLISGGYGDSGYLTSQEIYDPASGITTPTGGLNNPRAYHTTMLLPDGRVLIAGGHGNGNSPFTCELYNPVTGLSTPTAGFAYSHAEHTATLLANGSVLVVGGSTGAPEGAELYVTGGMDTDPIARTMTINVIPVNHPPLGSATTVATLEDTAYNFVPGDFGFTDPNDNPPNHFLAVKITTLPATGTLADNGVTVTAGQYVPAVDVIAGTLTFAPAANANGNAFASFTFQVQDDGGTANGGVDTDPAPKNITINVTPVNDPPSFTAGANVTVLEDSGAYSQTWATAISAGPADESAQVVHFNVSNNNNALFSSQPALAANGTLMFTPAANANGSATVTVTAQDNGGTANGGVDTSATQTFTITVIAVNDAPVFTPGGNVSVLEDSGAYNQTWATAISAGPPDESAQVVHFNVSNNNNALFSSQPAVAANGTLTFTPVANANGSATVSVAAQDNGGTANGGVDTSATQTFTITVTSVNDAPVGTSTTVTTLEDTAYTFSSADFGFTDPNDHPANNFLSVRISTLPAAGILADNGAVVTSGQFVPVADLTGGKLSFTPAANANGTSYASFTFQVRDDGGTANGGVDTDPSPKTLTINVTAVNDAPSFTAGTNIVVVEDSGIFSQVWATAISAGSPDESGQVVHFNVSNNHNGLFSSQPALAANGTLTFTPAANANGSASVTVTAQDNGGTANGGVDTSATQTFTITVIAVNDAPVFTPGGNVSVLEDSGAYNQTWATAISAGPPDESAQVVHFNVSNNNNALFSSQPAVAANGTLTFTPVANAHGSATVSVAAQDNGGTANGGVDTSATQTFTITVASVNDAPVGASTTVTTAENVAYTFAAANFGFADPNDNPPNNFLAVKITALPAVGSLKDNSVAVTAGQLVSVSDLTSGKLKFTPAAGAFGNPYAGFTFQVQDDGGTASGGVDTDPSPKTLTINVSGTDQAPTISAIRNLVVLENATLGNIPVTIGDPDDAANTLVISATTSLGGLINSFNYGGTGTARTVQPVLAANASGTTTVTVKVTDPHGATASTSFILAITAVNQAPSFALSAGSISARQDAGAQTVPGMASAISAGPPNESSQTVNFIVTTDNNALFSSAPAISSTGTLTYTPAAGTTGSATVTVKAHDNGGTLNGGHDTSAAQTFTITIIAVTHPAISLVHDLGAVSGGPGATPVAPVIEGRGDGALYGTTEFGGANGDGTLFKVNKDGSGYSVLRDLDFGAGDGTTPTAGLVEGSDGKLYGTTSSGGYYDLGTVFTIQKGGTGFAVLYNFGASGDGQTPYGGLVEGTDGALYGTTSAGGGNGSGTVFKITKDGSVYSTLYSFGAGTDGQNSYAGVVADGHGKLFGTTASGGANGCGTAFVIGENASGYAILHSFNFNGIDGAIPEAALIIGSDGNLYGTTVAGGVGGSGTVFRLSQNGLTYAVVYGFAAFGDAGSPSAALFEAGNGTLYGTAFSGGANDQGAVFQINKDGSNYSVLNSFNGTNGANPSAGLIQGSDGAFYGTASAGGTAGAGGVIQVGAP